MKFTWSYIKFRFKTLFKKVKEIEISPEALIELGRNKIEESFNMFTELRDQVANINNEIDEAQKEVMKEINSLESILKSKKEKAQRALDDIQANKSLMKKIEEFIPKQEKI